MSEGLRPRQSRLLTNAFSVEAASRSTLFPPSVSINMDRPCSDRNLPLAFRMEREGSLTPLLLSTTHVSRNRSYTPS